MLRRDGSASFAKIDLKPKTFSSYSGETAKDSNMARLAVLLLGPVLAIAVPHMGLAAAAGETTEVRAVASAPARNACLSSAETREAVKQHRLLEPFAVLKSAQSQFKAEALSAKLCRQGDDYVYEITLLHRDGRLVRPIMNAATGKFIEMRHHREAAPKPKE